MNINAVSFKRDPVLLGFAAILVLVVGGLVFTGMVSWKEAAAFLTGALALPGLFGAKDGGTPPPDEVTPVMALLALCALFSLSACSRPLTVDEKKAAAEGSYGAALQSCIGKSETRTAADACAADVRAQWSADGGVR